MYVKQLAAELNILTDFTRIHWFEAPEACRNCTDKRAARVEARTIARAERRK